MPHLPLIALRAFEAVARLGSMTAAAAELRVTHGAVSRQLKSLEARLGLPLLERLPRSVVASREGAQLAADLAEAFERIYLALSRVQLGPLTLSCSATVMMYWLLPRLGRFKREHPAVELRLNVNHGDVDFIRDEISVAIRNSMYQPPPTALGSTLMREEIGPVCHPDYAARLRIMAPSDLVHAHLLCTETRPQAWAEWTEAIGRPASRLRPTRATSITIWSSRRRLAGLAWRSCRVSWSGARSTPGTWSRRSASRQGLIRLISGWPSTFGRAPTCSNWQPGCGRRCSSEGARAAR